MGRVGGGHGGRDGTCAAGVCPFMASHRRCRLPHLDEVALHLLNHCVEQLLRVLRRAHCGVRHAGSAVCVLAPQGAEVEHGRRPSRSGQCTPPAPVPSGRRPPADGHAHRPRTQRRRVARVRRLHPPTFVAQEPTMRVTREKRLACTTTASLQLRLAGRAGGTTTARPPASPIGRCLRTDSSRKTKTKHSLHARAGCGAAQGGANTQASMRSNSAAAAHRRTCARPARERRRVRAAAATRRSASSFCIVSPTLSSLSRLLVGLRAGAGAAVCTQVW